MRIPEGSALQRSHAQRSVEIIFQLRQPAEFVMLQRSHAQRSVEACSGRESFGPGESCFNGATLREAWRSSSYGRHRSSSTSFNEAALLRARRYSGRRDRRIRDRPSTGPHPEERGGYSERQSEGHRDVASTEPRSEERGDAERRPPRQSKATCFNGATFGRSVEVQLEHPKRSEACCFNGATLGEAWK